MKEENASLVLLGIGYVFWPRVVAVVIVELSLAAIISK
jgi:hypothetical protein